MYKQSTFHKADALFLVWDWHNYISLSQSLILHKEHIDITRLQQLCSENSFSKHHKQFRLMDFVHGPSLKHQKH